MNATYFSPKKLKNDFFKQRKDFSLQGKCLTQRNMPTVIASNFLNQQARQKSIFEPVLHSFSSKMIKQRYVNQRKYLKSSQNTSKDRKNYIIKSNKTEESQIMLSNIISKDQARLTQLRCKNRQIKSQNKDFVQPKSQNRLQVYLNEQIKNQYIKIDNLKRTNEKQVLQSTNMTITSLSYMKKYSKEQKKKRQNEFNKFQSKRTENQIRKKIIEIVNSKLSKQDFLNEQITKNNSQNQQQIRLSLKSMVKSEVEQTDFNQRLNEEQFFEIQSKNMVKLEKDQINLQKKVKEKPFITARKYKANRMIIKYDKRFLTNSSQFNDPCLKIQKIHQFSSRIKTQQNL